MDTPQPEARPGLGEIVQKASERGREIRSEKQEQRREKREQFVSAIRERAGQIKERARNAATGAKEAAGKVTKGFETAGAVIRGMTDPNVRAEFGQYIQERAGEARKTVEGKINQIHEKFDNKREQTVNSFQDRVREIRQEVDEHVATPVKEKAKKTQDSIIAAAIRGAVFTYLSYNAGLEAGRQTVEAGKQAVETGKQKVEDTKNRAESRARAFGEKLTGFFSSQSEKIKTEIQARRLNITASVLDVLAKPPELRGVMLENLGRKISSAGESGRVTARERREKSSVSKSAINELRARAAAQGGE